MSNYLCVDCGYIWEGYRPDRCDCGNEDDFAPLCGGHLDVSGLGDRVRAKARAYDELVAKLREHLDLYRTMPATERYAGAITALESLLPKESDDDRA